MQRMHSTRRRALVRSRPGNGPTSSSSTATRSRFRRRTYGRSKWSKPGWRANACIDDRRYRPRSVPAAALEQFGIPRRIDIRTADDEAKPLALKSLPQRPEDGGGSRRGRRFGHQFGVAKQVVHRTAKVVVGHPDDFVDEAPANAETIRQRIGRTQAVSHGVHARKLLRYARLETSIQRVRAERLHAVHGAGRIDLLDRRRY